MAAMSPGLLHPHNASTRHDNKALAFSKRTCVLALAAILQSSIAILPLSSSHA